MPHGRHKVPFSGKAKKQQLKEKKIRQQFKNDHTTGIRPTSKNYLISSSSNVDDQEDNFVSLNKQPGVRLGRNPNRFNLRFHREPESEIRRKKEEARKSIMPVNEESLELNIDDYFPPELQFPIRPPWDFSMSREELNAAENRYFTEYVKTIEENFTWSELSYFELNLETWRQLWRVLEMADVVLLITDVRFPALMLPPSLYTYVTETLNKNLIVVLNKIDLAPSPLVVAWKHYLKTKYPGIHILMFTSYPSYNLRNSSDKKKGLKITRRKGKMRMAAEGAQKLLDACKDIVKGQVDLASWQEKISEEMLLDSDIEDEDIEVTERINLKNQDADYHSHKLYDAGVLTIGCIGQPNVGKSSLMNALMGKKVVSVSRTPGHTKHFQTIFLTQNVRLCDCPGLVFPSKVPKALQVLMGSFPIAQLREPYSCVQFLAERVDLVSLLRIQHPEQDEYWSAMDICDGWAMKKGFYTAKTARLDSYRAANHLLRMALEGKIPLCLRPPGYSLSQESWESHSDVQIVNWIQAALHNGRERKELVFSDEESEDESEEARPRFVSNQPQSSEESSEEEYIESTNKFQALNFTE